MNVEEQTNENAIDISAIKENIKELQKNRDHDKINMKISTDYASKEFTRLNERVTIINVDYKTLEHNLTELKKDIQGTTKAIKQEIQDIKEHRKFWSTIKQLGYLKWIIGIIIAVSVFFYGLHVENTENTIKMNLNKLSKTMMFENKSYRK